MGSVHALPVATEPWVSKKQIAQHYGRSLTWMKRTCARACRTARETPPGRCSASPRWTLAALARGALESAAD